MASRPASAPGSRRKQDEGYARITKPAQKQKYKPGKGEMPHSFKGRRHLLTSTQKEALEMREREEQVTEQRGAPAARAEFHGNRSSTPCTTTSARATATRSAS